MKNKKLKLFELERIDVNEFKQLNKRPIVLLLDNIRSAQNIGSFFRTADAFLIETIILTGICATPPNKEILKTALGSTESVSWSYKPDALSAVKNLKEKGWRIMSVEQASESIELHQFEPTIEEKYVFIFGNEVDGVQQAIIDESDSVIEIPQFGTKHSLNVSVSAGIVLWDVYQKMYLG
ncbi:MAG: RNA methyltransferase [Bacteroidia bacterium]|jgi:tRNA G18 (ribose-2'-O)-methylase SpoU|nr:RNA methyltransferase [Bacteroidia bacterium]